MEICCYDSETASLKKAFNLPLMLREQTATINNIADMTSAEAFEGESVVLLDADNLRIPDSIGTRGMI